MNKIQDTVKKLIVKYGAVIASCAFAFVAISANTSCLFPFYEPEEPEGLQNFKKFNKQMMDSMKQKVSHGYISLKQVVNNTE